MSRKIDLDKYYTPPDLAKWCIDKTFKVIGKNNITHIIEPSAGNGSFSKQLECDAYDIAPEDESIVKSDFLNLDIPYKQGRLIIGNPPYGVANTLAVQFYKKSIQLCDYIAFILPSSQYNNNNQMYEFDLIHSELIDNKDFTELDKRINLTFNIYKRNKNGFNSKPNYKLQDVVIKEARKGSKNNVTNDYDIGICSYGWSLGKETDYIGQYANEFYFYIKNNTYREEIINLIKNAKWKEIVQNMTGIEKINQWQAYKYLKEQIPELQ